MFETPIPFDRTAIELRPRPDAWGKGQPVEVVSLQAPLSGSTRAGWCSYPEQLAEAPDVEIMCGGINSKLEGAAALWRQGHLLHFGFDLAPDEMNDNGRALLVNSICYIADFTTDRALLRAPSPFAGQGTRARASVAQWLADASKLEWFTGALDPAALAGVATDDHAALQAWFAANRRFLRPGPAGKLTVDPDLAALGCGFDDATFFSTAIAALDDPTKQAAARAALTRFAPDGPSGDADGKAWQAWFDATEPYLFFSEWGGYRWYIDPLAKARGVPSRELRGRRRAG